jgi:FKBP-type peptidyl-prolyl cis-trans isomerase
MRRAVPIFVLSLALVLPGCGGSDSAEDTAQASKPLRLTLAKTNLHKPYELQTLPKGPPPDKLVIRELHRGYGAPAKDGDMVMVMYLDADFRDKSGKLFYSSWNQDELFTFKLGGSKTTDTWDKGVEGMRLGGRRELIMPANLADRAPGDSPVIPPEADTVVFVVDLYGRG